MALLETLILGIGTSIAKAALKLWLKESPLIAATGTGFLSILEKKMPDVLKRNAAEREFRQIADRAGESVRQMLEKEEVPTVEEACLEVIANAAAQTVNEAPIDTQILAEHDLDPESLVNYYLQRTTAEGGNPGFAGTAPDDQSFPKEEQLVYRLILSHACQLIVDVSSQLPRFDERVNAEILKRLGSVAEQVIEGMNRVIEGQADTFEGDYRNACVRRHDQLELFGVDLVECERRYNLSIAYVTLMVEGSAHNDATEEAGEEEVDLRFSVPADEALAVNTRLFVRGPAGSGKTTLLQWFAVFSSGRSLEGDLEPLNGCVPFLIKLRHFSDSKLPTPKDFPAEASKAIADNAPTGWVVDRLTSGKALVLIDGLDEVAEKRRKEVRDWLRDLIGAYPEARYVITSRPHAAEEGWLDADKFVDAELQDMARGDIDEFIDHWHDAVAESIREDEEKAKLPGLAKALKGKLGKNAAVYRLATSPLLCALLCALHRQRVANLPGDRVQLYRACIDMFFRRDVEKEVDTRDYLDLTDRQKSVLLQDFAWWMIRNRKTTASPEEAQQRFGIGFQRLRGDKPEDGNGKAVVKLFMQRIGIIRQLAAQKIDFPHRTFQEYLAAHAAIEEEDLGVLVHSAHDDQWREVVILTAGLLPSKRAEALIRDLLERGDKEAKNRHAVYMVAMASLDVVVAPPEDSEIESEVRRRLKKIVPPKNISSATALAAAGDLVVPFLKHDPKRPAAATAASVRTLALIGTESAHEALIAYADDPRASVDAQLLTSLMFARDPEAYAHIVKNVTVLSYLNRRHPTSAALGSLPNLCNLSINGSKLQDVAGLGNSRSLKSLTLDRCPFLQNVDGIAGMSSLQKLSIVSCQALQNVDGMSGIDSLQKLDLSWCRSLQNVDGVANLNPLVRLSLHHCRSLQNVDGLSGQVSLTSLELHECSSLESVKGLSALNSLQTLDLEGCNSLQNIDGLSGLASLRTLDLRSCRALENIDGVSELKSLTTLDLKGCRSLRCIRGLVGLNSLQTLDLRECISLQRIDGLLGLNSLRRIDLRGCSSLFVDYETIRKLLPKTVSIII